MTEEWRDVPDTAGRYQVSSLGRLRRGDLLMAIHCDRYGYPRATIYIPTPTKAKRLIRDQMARGFYRNDGKGLIGRLATALSALTQTGEASDAG